MDWLTFTVEITKAVAWPSATIATALLFHRQLRDLLGRVKKGKIGPAEFEFEEIVRELKSEVAELSPNNPAATVSPTTVSLAISDPRSVIMSSWIEVEAALDNLVRKIPNTNRLATATLGPYQQVRTLEKAGILASEHGALFRNLRHLRNQAAHEQDFSPSTDSVLTFAQMTKDLTSTLEHLANERP